MGIAIIFISHDLNVVQKICDSVAIIYLGNIVEIASKKEIFDKAVHPYTKLLLSSKTKTDPCEKKEKNYTFEDIPNIIDAPPGCKFSTRCPKYKKGLCDKQRPLLDEISKKHYVACIS